MALETTEPQAQFQEAHIEVDGFRVRTWEAGQGGPVVILDTLSWGLTRLHHALAMTNRVVVLELPGFGSSAANDRSRSVQDLAANDGAGLPNSVESGNFTLIRRPSFAANVALWQAIQVPDQIEALILIFPYRRKAYKHSPVRRGGGDGPVAAGTSE